MKRSIAAFPLPQHQKLETRAARGDHDAMRALRGFAIGIAVSLPAWALIAWGLCSIA